MRLARLVILLIWWPLFFMAALLAHGLLWLCASRRRWRWMSRWINWTFAALVRALLNIKVEVEGDTQEAERGGCLIASNHLGYVDGVVLGSLFPLIYVSKKEVRGWPWIGAWTALCGTVYIDRQRKEKIPLMVAEMAEKLNQGANVLMFPEGTSTNGDRLLSFQPAPFAAPLRAQAPVVPVTLTYRRINGRPVSRDNRDLIYWYGDMEFLGHFWELLAVRRVEVTVRIHPAINSSRYKNDSLGRRALSQKTHDAIAGRRAAAHEQRLS
jgi:1-acyl-sn-glycerol-3-phosphate acyltransferase